MKRAELNKADFDLVGKAQEIIRLRQKEDWHTVSSVLRTKSGRIFKGLHLEAYIGRIAVCAEAIAIGSAAIDGDTEIETIVAVGKTGEIVSPCGMCRELISDYSPNAEVILRDKTGAFKTSIKELLPLKYKSD